jgi:DNA primase
MGYDSRILDDLRSRVDIVDIIGGYIELRRSGANFKGVCPFHNDTNPSLTVSPSRQIYKCFVCDAGGNAFTFVKEYLNVNFTEAVKIVADRVGYSLPEQHQTEKQKQQLSERDAIQKALDYTADFYHRKLYMPEGKHALNYLLQRGFSEDVIKKFNLGYAPDGWDTTLKELRRVNFEEQTIIGARIAIHKEDTGRIYDMFRNRLMFPIRDYMGRTIAFGGRKLDENPDSPKYINSPESLVYNKSHTLFGLFDGKRDIINKNEVVLVEGYADLIALAQFGFTNTVAPCGTAFTESQAEMIKRSAKSITLMYDGDNAGLNAAERSTEIAIAAGLKTKVVILPDGEDPDDILKSRGEKVMRRYLDGAVNFVDFLIEQNKDILTSPEGKAEIARKLTNIIAKIPDKFVHDDYMQEVATKLHLSLSQVDALYREKSSAKKPKLYSSENFYEPRQGEEAHAPVQKVKLTIVDAVHLLPADAANILTPPELNILKILITSKNALSLIEDKYDIHSGYFRSDLGKNLFSIVYELAYESSDILKDIFMDEDIEKYFADIIIAISLPAEELYADWDKYGGMISVTKEEKVIEAAINEIIRQKLRSDRRKFEDDLESTSNEDMQRQILNEMLHIDKKLLEKNLIQYKDTLLVDDIKII